MAPATAAQAALPVNPTGQPYTIAQQAWLNFADKVQRGEQLDPTGQYVKAGIILPANKAVSKRPKLSAGRDEFRFILNPDGTIVSVSKAKAIANPGTTTNLTDPIDNPPQECPPGGCPTYPVITSQFYQSTGLGGGGAILDLKVAIGRSTYPGYAILYGNLNSGAGGREIYYQFTRDPASIRQGAEYYKSSYSTVKPLTRYDTRKGSFFSHPDAPNGFWPVWYASDPYWYNWAELDLNDGAGGEYIYSFDTKEDCFLTSTHTSVCYNSFQEVGVLIGNSDQIRPPAGWSMHPADLNEGAGGDHIYFCYKSL